MTTRTQRVLWWMLVIGWMALIYFLSSRPDLHSGLQPTWDVILRKIAHMVEYGILTWLLIQAIRAGTPITGRTMLISISLASLYALSDEYHQTFIVGRHGSPIDWLIDLVGVGTAAIIIQRH